MGLDIYTCDSCENTFIGGGDEVNCECGLKWCDSECAESDGFRHEENGFKPANSNWEQETSCNYCRNENFADSELLWYAINQLLIISREDLIEKYKESL